MLLPDVVTQEGPDIRMPAGFFSIARALPNLNPQVSFWVRLDRTNGFPESSAARPERCPLLNCVSRMRPGDQPGRRTPLLAGLWPFGKRYFSPMFEPFLKPTFSLKKSTDFW